MTIRRIVAGALAAAALIVAAGVPRAAAAGPTTDPATAASFGAGWLARQVNAQGYVPGSSGADPSATANTALALAAAGVGGDAFTRDVGYLRTHIDDYVTGTGGDRPAALGT